MPELPEVETVANGVHARVRGQQVLSVWTSNKPQTFKSPPHVIAEALTGARIERVRRIGKLIAIDLYKDLHNPALDKAAQFPAQPQRPQFLVHLGMTGRLLVSEPEVSIPPHTHAILTLSGGKQLRFVDARRFGRLSIAENYAGPGVEPLTVALEDFIALFRGRRTPIKAALLNQSLLHGVGNIYADESLFRAGIRPTRHAGRLTRAELARLRAALRQVLKRAIQLGGSSVSDYVDADAWPGSFSCSTRCMGARAKGAASARRHSRKPRLLVARRFIVLPVNAEGSMSALSALYQR